MGAGGAACPTQSCHLVQASRPLWTDVTQVFPWWLYLNGFPDGVELLNKGVRQIVMAELSASSDAAYAFVVTVGDNSQWTVDPRQRKAHPGSMCKTGLVCV